MDALLHAVMAAKMTTRPFKMAEWSIMFFALDVDAAINTDTRIFLSFSACSISPPINVLFFRDSHLVPPGWPLRQGVAPVGRPETGLPGTEGGATRGDPFKVRAQRTAHMYSRFRTTIIVAGFVASSPRRRSSARASPPTSCSSRRPPGTTRSRRRTCECKRKCS